MEDASCGFGGVFAADVGGAVSDPGGRYIASIVGRIAAPKGVDKKSVGKSIETKIDQVLSNVVVQRRTFDISRYSSSRQKSNTIIRKRITVEI